MWPEWANRAWLCARALLKRRQLDRDLEDEVAFHLNMREQSNRDSWGSGRKRLAFRMAMGAVGSGIVKMVLCEALLLAGVAVALGLAGALALTRVMESLLYETAPTDPLTLVAASVGVMFVATLATLVPARRAMHVDPMIALRYE